MLVKDAGEMTIVSVQKIRNRFTVIINPQPLHNIFPKTGQVDGLEFSTCSHTCVSPAGVAWDGGQCITVGCDLLSYHPP